MHDSSKNGRKEHVIPMANDRVSLDKLRFGSFMARWKLYTKLLAVFSYFIIVTLKLHYLGDSFPRSGNGTGASC